MRNVVFYTCLVVFVLIQAIDMELTQMYIHENWRGENWWTMRIMIREFGIYGAIAVCRLATFMFLLGAMHYKSTRLGFNVLLLSTLMYCVFMTSWLWELGYIEYPFKDLS